MTKREYYISLGGSFRWNKIQQQVEDFTVQDDKPIRMIAIMTIEVEVGDTRPTLEGVFGNVLYYKGFFLVVYQLRV